MGSSRYSPNRCDTSRGFTLVDVIVSVSIVGLMVALLLPAVQKAREAARSVECKNNIKQLALACHNHHDVHGFFPSGGWGWYWVGDADRGFGKDQPGGWIFNLLPYFEQYTLYGQSSDGNPDVLTRTQRGGAASVIRTPLSIINCPSRRPNTVFTMSANEGGSHGYFNSVTPRVAGRSDYAINSGHMYSEWPHRALGQGPKSYTEARVWSANHYWGGESLQVALGQPVMTGISFERSNVSIIQVDDGLSQTYLLGEKHVPIQHYETGRDKGDNETWCTGFNNDNYRCTGRVVGGQVVESTPLSDWVHDADDFNGRFGTPHPSGWNAAFSDGSVHTVALTIDWQVHRDRGNRQDGRALADSP